MDQPIDLLERTGVTRRLAVALLARLALSDCRDTRSKVVAPRSWLENGCIAIPPRGPQVATITAEEAKVGENVALRLPRRLIRDELRTVRLYSAFGGRVPRILPDMLTS